MSAHLPSLTSKARSAATRYARRLPKGRHAPRSPTGATLGQSGPSEPSPCLYLSRSIEWIGIRWITNLVAARNLVSLLLLLPSLKFVYPNL